MNKFQNNLKQLRKLNNLTQTDLATKIQESTQVISNWERGYTIPDMNDLITLADFFNVSVDELIGRKHTPSNDLINKVKQLEDIVRDIKSYL